MTYDEYLKKVQVRDSIPGPDCQCCDRPTVRHPHIVVFNKHGVSEKEYDESEEKFTCLNEQCLEYNKTYKIC